MPECRAAPSPLPPSHLGLGRPFHEKMRPEGRPARSRVVKAAGSLGLAPHYREGFELDPCELAQFLLVGPTQCGEKALCQHLCGHLWIGLLGFNPVVQLLHGDSEGFAVEVEHFEDFVRHLVFGSTLRRIGQQRTIEARFLLSTAILSDSKQKLFCAVGWSKCGERNAKKLDAFRDRELGFEQIQANPLHGGSFFDYPGQ
jgi:hypothetical protein